MTRMLREEKSVTRLIEGFKGKKICVVGDIIADVYIFGKPYRLSREAPVVVVKHEEEKVYPGSAGNTISNLLALGAEVFPLGFIGSDAIGDKLVEYFSKYPTIDMKGIIRHKGETVSKTRILAGDTHTSKQQVIRIDKDANKPVSKRERSLLMEKLAELAPRMDGFVVSDYGHGLIDRTVTQFMADMSKQKVVVGDSRYNLKSFKGFTLITPNESEALSLAFAKEGADIEAVGKKIMDLMGVTALLITRGNRGMSLFEADGSVRHIPISGSNDVTDVTGAGDTVCAAVTLSLASGGSFFDSCRIANFAAGIVVMKRGTATVTADELREAVSSR